MSWTFPKLPGDAFMSGGMNVSFLKEQELLGRSF